MNAILSPASVDSALEGFEFVQSDGLPFITLDNQRRFYLNAGLRKMFGIKAYDRVAIAYNPSEKALALLLNGAENAVSSGIYIVDKRHYLGARKFCAQYAYSSDGAPFTFVFDRGTSTSGVFIFRLQRNPA